MDVDDELESCSSQLSQVSCCSTCRYCDSEDEEEMVGGVDLAEINDLLYNITGMHLH